jgi:23S rRNA-intervening sequence protein
MSTASSKALEMENKDGLIRISHYAYLIEAPVDYGRKTYRDPDLAVRHGGGRKLCEARGAESRKDFIHKIRIVLKELNETAIWLQLIAKSSLLPPEMISGVLAENRELCRIMAASVKTARSALP